MSTATLNDLGVTDAKVFIGAWGCWFAEVCVDGEHELAKGSRVSLKLADVTFSGTVLSGGASKGRSFYRIVAGAGGWGRRLKRKAYANDAGVKVVTVLGDAATECGETLAPFDSAARVGPGWARPEAPGARLLELLSPGAWYVDESGVTHLGARPPGTLPAGATLGQVDLARGSVTIASEQIAAIVPGLVVAGMTVVDVLHEVSAKGGLRSTVWGAMGGGGTSRELEALRRVLEQLDPQRRFRGVTEYRIVGSEGKRLTLQPVKVSLGMPELTRVKVRPGVAGCDAELADGMRVLVGFVNSDPAGAYVAGFEDAEGDTFQPTKLSLLAGGSAGGEHIATVESVCLLLYNTLYALMLAAGGGPLTALVLQPLLGAAITAGLGAGAVAAPPGLAAQLAAATSLQAGVAAGSAPSNAMLAAWTTAIEGAAKTPNVSGAFPALGCAAVEGG